MASKLLDGEKSEPAPTSMKFFFFFERWEKKYEMSTRSTIGYQRKGGTN